MDVVFINPFIAATNNVIKQMTGQDLVLGQLSLGQSPLTSGEISVLIGVNGKVKGFIAFSLNATTLNRLTAAMMGGWQAPLAEELCRSAVSELANMIAGNASSIFSEQGIKMDITPPTVVEGKDTKITSFVKNIIVVPLRIESIGSMEMKVGLEKVA